ncbi:hypothetical protein PPO43_07030 [Saprospira sp. CCB-QB6]|uniref:hypothetical protein n=1 Tax=Saprospira sp. CCB-QB6 TaxID=3023936 RepID=UPI00234A3AF1|nr:hypothetical protein [Saprospira sp. CCB-QB6]WCL82841.1 hypothetical protein PPO43_07030 [Saprospira sp. CCB-QB6]
MSILFTFIVLIAVLALVAAVFAFMLPQSWRIEEVAQLAASPKELLALFQTPANWPNWSAWTKEQGYSFSFEGPEAGPGAMMFWKSKQISAKLIITQANEQQINFELEVDRSPLKIQGIMALDNSIPDYTQLAWRLEADLPHNSKDPLGRYQAYFLKNYFKTSLLYSLQRLEADYGFFEDEEEEEQV